MGTKLNLDKLDLQIIHEMLHNAEVSYAELGKKLFVSGGTIHVRIKKLEEFGIVKGKKLQVDLKLLGYDITAFVGIFLEKSSLRLGLVNFSPSRSAKSSISFLLASYWSD